MRIQTLMILIFEFLRMSSDWVYSFNETTKNNILHCIGVNVVSYANRAVIFSDIILGIHNNINLSQTSVHIEKYKPTFESSSKHRYTLRI